MKFAPALLLLSLLLLPAAVQASQASDSFSFSMKTTQGPIEFDCPQAWAPLGSEHLHELLEKGYYTHVAFFRVIAGFVAQFGISGTPSVSSQWNTPIADDPVRASNLAGTLSFATAGPNTRTTQLFINLVDNTSLDRLGFSPVCKTDAAGLSVAKALYSGYGEAATDGGTGPEQDLIYQQGNTYLKGFPKLDYALSVSVK